MADKNKIILGTNADTYIAADDAGNIVLQHEAGQRVSLTNEAILPSENETLDLGSAEKKFKDLYLSNNTIYMGDNNTPVSLSENGTLTVDGEEVGGGGSPDIISEIKGYDFGASSNDPTLQYPDANTTAPFDSYHVPMGNINTAWNPTAAALRASYDPNLLDFNEAFNMALKDAVNDAFFENEQFVFGIRTPKDNSIYTITTNVIKYDIVYSGATLPSPQDIGANKDWWQFDGGREQTRVYEFKHLFKPGNALAPNGHAWPSGGADDSIDSFMASLYTLNGVTDPNNNLQRWRSGTGAAVNSFYGGNFPMEQNASQNEIDLGGVLVNISQNNGLQIEGPTPGTIEESYASNPGTIRSAFTNQQIPSAIYPYPGVLSVQKFGWDYNSPVDYILPMQSSYNTYPYIMIGPSVFDYGYAFDLYGTSDYGMFATKLDFKIKVEKIPASNLPLPIIT